jgi:hypothetical protein
MSEHNPSRREFIKKVGYAAPAIVTLTAFPALAKAGSLRAPPLGSGAGGETGSGAAAKTGNPDRWFTRVARAIPEILRKRFG